MAIWCYSVKKNKYHGQSTCSTICKKKGKNLYHNRGKNKKSTKCIFKFILVKRSFCPRFMKLLVNFDEVIQNYIQKVLNNYMNLNIDNR
jgi:hypothetical protein